MYSKADKMMLQNGIALLPIMPQILPNKAENFTNLISAIYWMTIKKLKPSIFDIKCITEEYFDYLLMRNTYKTTFIGDIKSCALLSVNSLAVLSATSKSWIKIEEFNCELNSPDQQTKNENFKEICNAAPSSNDGKHYCIQCYAISSIGKDFVLYVTNEKYYNIMQYLSVNVVIGPSFKANVEKIEYKGWPEVAKAIILGHIDSGIDIEINNVQLVAEKFFVSPKHLKKGEVFCVNVKKIIPYINQTLNLINVKYIYFKVLNIVSNNVNAKEEFGFYIVDKHTSINLQYKLQNYVPSEWTKYVNVKNKTGYEIPICPAGLDKYYLKLELLFKVFLQDNVAHMKPMVLLTGTKGCGKKTVLSCVTGRFGLKLFTADCFDFISIDAPTLESRFRALITKIKKMAPAVLHLENIELLGRDEQYRECVTVIDVFQKNIDKLFKEKLKAPVIIVASCHQKLPELIPSIERMFIQTISFGPMKNKDTFSVLNWLVQEVGMTCFPEVLREVAEKVNGYLFADLVKLIRLTMKFQREDPAISEETSLLLKTDHLEKAIGIMESHYSDTIGSAKVPSVHWEDVGGLDSLKEEITIALNFPTKHPDLMASGLRVSGFLFYGPPGTGKTLMAKAVATEFSYNFLSVKGPELMNMYVGQSEKNIREVFQRARDAAPCIIFFDELDSIAPNRGRSSGLVTDKIVSQLLTEMDGLQSNKGVFIIGATNRPDLVDPALLRPGRFDKMFYVGVCENKSMKLSVMEALTRRFSLSDAVKLEEIVEQLPAQVTGADIYSVCSNAWFEAARRYIKMTNEGKEVSLPVIVTQNDFEIALKTFVPSLTADVVQYYEEFRNWEK